MASRRLTMLGAILRTSASERSFALLLLCTACAALALLPVSPPLTPVLFGVSGGLLALLVLSASKGGLLRLRRRLVSSATMAELERAPEVAVLTDGTGGLVAINGRSAALNAGERVLERAIERVSVDPTAVISRLLKRLEHEEDAEEALGSPRYGARIRVTRLSAKTLLWTISSRMVEPDLALLSVSHGEAAPNGAAEAMLGNGRRALRDIVVDLPLRQGGLHRLRTTDGSEFEARLVEIQAGGQRSEIALLPSTPLGVAGESENTSALAIPDLLNVLPVPMLKVSEEGTLLEANQEARSILAIEEDTLPPLFELVEGMGRPIADWLSDAANGRGLLKPEIVRAVMPGQELFLQITLGRRIENGRPVLVGILNDATELKTLEAQFVQSQKIQAIGQLAGGVAHDFNNLLTAISGHCDLLLLRHEPSDPEYADLIQISQNANRAASLVGQLLAFSRKQNLKPQALDLRDTMADLAHLLNRLIGERVQLEVTHAPGPQMIRADRRQLEQVIVNLVVNARDAMPEGGKIDVVTRTEHLAEPVSRDRARLPPGDYVVIEVRDTGCGIPAEAMSKIFEPFFSTKKTGEGTGLGLSTAYGIVKQTGGFIFVDSTASVGTVFTLYFPATSLRETAEPDAEKPAAPKTAARGDATILLVEDEAPVRAFACRALRLRGYTVIEAADAEEALSVLEDKALKIDLFVTDVIMPGLDGPTWVRQALKDRPDTSVVFMSGYAEEGRAEKQARIPNSVFLPKPFSLQQLTTVVQEQLA